MNKLTIDHEKESCIVVVAPRQKNYKDYELIMNAVGKSIDLAEYDAGENKKSNFVFVHDTSGGAVSHVIGAVNVFQNGLRLRGRYASTRKLDLNILLHGKQAQYRWLDTAFTYDPDLVLIIDNGQFPLVDYAQKLANEHSVPTYRIKIPYRPEKERVF